VNSCRRIVTVGVCLVTLGLAVYQTDAGAAATSKPTTIKKKTNSRSTTRKQVTTRKLASTSTAITTRVAASSTAPTTIAPAVTTSVTVAPTVPVGSTTNPSIVGASPVANSPIGFEQPSYAITMPAGSSVTSSFFLKVATGFNDTVDLRIPSLPAGVTVRFDPNPTRNFVTITIQISSTSQPVIQFQIEAVASGNPTVVLARTTLTVFVSGTTSPATPIDVANGDPKAPPGIITGVSPSSFVVTRGGDAVSAQIDFVRQGGFAGPIRLEVTSAVPRDLITSFKYKDALGVINYFFVSAGQDTPLGTYTVIVDVVTSLGRSSFPVQVTVR
jgi:hypothetical protein